MKTKLLPTQAPFYDGAKLLIAADCTAYAYANMHEDWRSCYLRRIKR